MTQAQFLDEIAPLAKSNPREHIRLQLAWLGRRCFLVDLLNGSDAYIAALEDGGGLLLGRLPAGGSVASFTLVPREDIAKVESPHVSAEAETSYLRRRQGPRQSLIMYERRGCDPIKKIVFQTPSHCECWTAVIGGLIRDDLSP